MRRRTNRILALYETRNIWLNVLLCNIHLIKGLILLLSEEKLRMGKNTNPKSDPQSKSHV